VLPNETYLDKIVQRRREDLSDRMFLVPLAEVKARALDLPPTLDFEAALRRPGIQVVAEFKKASPSKGEIAPDADPADVAKSYLKGGAAAISVLTEEPHFHGSLDYLGVIKDALGDETPPLLRKDFILEDYQVFESRAHRADALLLIVALLSDGQLQDLLGRVGELGLSALVEIHNEEEAESATVSGAQVVGINNRDLHTFETDLETTATVRPHVPEGAIVVSESGIKTPEDVARLADWGVDAFLIGEALMTAADPGALLQEFLSSHD
jgi:indole-3-glycerol phosphate synthase